MGPGSTDTASVSADQLLPILRACWSSETSGHWMAENPARGQCNVTALVVHDMLGGEILRTAAPGGWHFYNRVASHRLDLTESQFAVPIAYADVASSREEALAGTTPERYAALRNRVDALHSEDDGRSG